MQIFSSSSSSHNKSSIKSKLGCNRTHRLGTLCLASKSHAFWHVNDQFHYCIFGEKMYICGTYIVLCTLMYVSMLYMCISIRIPLGHSFWCCLENNGVCSTVVKVVVVYVWNGCRQLRMIAVFFPDTWYIRVFWQQPLLAYDVKWEQQCSVVCMTLVHSPVYSTTYHCRQLLV